MASGQLKKVGSFIGTGAAKDIELDFTPRYVKIVNMTTRDSAEKFAEADVSGSEGGIKRPVAGGAVAALNAAAGITLGVRKFSVGTDAAVNGNGNHMSFLAIE
jgi:hypothetical protein